jgi:hypothetical protein
METMVMMAGMELPAKAIREQIASAIDLIVHQTRFRDGSRKIVNISEIVGMEGDMVTIQDIFTYRRMGLMEQVISPASSPLREFILRLLQRSVTMVGYAKMNGFIRN